MSHATATPTGEARNVWPTTPRQAGEGDFLHRPPARAASNNSNTQSDVFIDAVSTTGQYNEEFVEQNINQLPNGVVLKCLNVFTNKFPELAILHLPSFLEELRLRQSKEIVALLSTVLAVTRSQICVLNATWAEDLLPREHYASYAKDLLKDLILQQPKVQVVQALLIITLHEWGSRDFHKAWVYCGKSFWLSFAMNIPNLLLKALPFVLCKPFIACGSLHILLT